MARERIPGGRAAGLPSSTFSKAQLRRGCRVEMEHTNDRATACEIARDHLTEDPKYYSKLAKVHLDGPSSPKRKWIAHAPCLPKSTKDPDWTREKFHKCLVNNALKIRKPTRGKPVAILTMGGPASGKSTMLAHTVKGSDFVKSDPDAIKEELPEYQLAVSKSAKDAAFMAHNESSEVADQIAERAVRDRKNLIIDGTGKNIEKYLAAIQELKDSGYHVTVLAASIPVDEAKKRAANRAERNGRWVPPEIIEDIYSKVPCNLRRAAEAADDFALFDNESGTPRPVMKKENGKSIEILDREYVNRLTGSCSTETALTGLRGGAKSDAAVSLDEVMRRIRSAKRCRR